MSENDDGATLESAICAGERALGTGVSPCINCGGEVAPGTLHVFMTLSPTCRRFVPAVDEAAILFAARNIVNQCFDALGEEIAMDGGGISSTEVDLGPGASEVFVDARQLVNDRCDELAVRVITELTRGTLGPS